MAHHVSRVLPKVSSFVPPWVLALPPSPRSRPDLTRPDLTEVGTPDSADPTRPGFEKLWFTGFEFEGLRFKGFPPGVLPGFRLLFLLDFSFFGQNRNSKFWKLLLVFLIGWHRRHPHDNVLPHNITHDVK